MFYEIPGESVLNVIPPKALIVESLKKKKQELTQLIGWEFEVYDELVAAKVNAAKYLEYLLSRPAINISEIAPKDKILLCQFTDMAQWLKWSRYFSGITTTRLKVVEFRNLNRLTILTAGIYLVPMIMPRLRSALEESTKNTGS